MNPEVAHVVLAVADEFDVAPAELLAVGRPTATVSDARQILMYLLGDVVGPEALRALFPLDRATIRHHRLAAKGRLVASPVYAAHLANIRRRLAGRADGWPKLPSEVNWLEAIEVPFARRRRSWPFRSPRDLR